MINLNVKTFYIKKKVERYSKYLKKEKKQKCKKKLNKVNYEFFK